jgi:fumarate reductase flavoprotein subunit
MMGLNAGAAIEGQGKGQLLPTPGFLKRLEVSLPPWLVMVNHEGRRFIDESANAALMAVRINQQAGNECFAVFDEALRLAAAPTGRVKKLIEQGRAQTSWVPDVLEEFTAAGKIIKANTIAELAQRCGIAPGALEQTIREYNADTSAGEDRHFLKPAELMKPLTAPPFYAARIRPATVCLTSTGLRIDLEGRVLDQSGVPIRGLFAAGEVTGGTLGTIYAGGGNSVCNAMVGGRIAGAAAATAAAA